MENEDTKHPYRQIVGRILEMIRSGELKLGERLPPERKLAERFGVSRGSLRQAFQALAERRMLEGRQGDGTYLLTSPDALLSIDTIVDGIGKQRGVLRDIVEFRRIMEPQIAALAALRMAPEEIDRLKVLVCDQQRAILAGREDGVCDAEFHHLLATGAGNQVILQVMTVVRSIVDQSRSVWLQSAERRRASVEGHLRIIDALEARDQQKAVSAMQEHIAEIESHIFDDPQNVQI
jgi:GntR family transcriptional repressor for pyruvate dehydrogenase complex